MGSKMHHRFGEIDTDESKVLALRVTSLLGI